MNQCLLIWVLNILMDMNFFGVFEFNVCGTYSVPDGENLTDSEIRKMIDNIVFEHCEIHLH